MKTAILTTLIAFYLADVPAGMTDGRSRSLAIVVAGLISLVAGGLALARSRRIGAGNGRAGAIFALVVALLAVVLSGVHLATFTGGFGTGSGRAGAIVALVLALIGMILGGLALARGRREHKAPGT